MFCPNCGTSNPDNAIFCEECGTKIESQTKKTKTITVKNKLIIGEAVVLIILLICAYKLGEKKLGAEAVASKYFEQVMSGNWEGAYDNLEIVDSPFLSKNLFVQVNKNNERKEYTTYKVEYSSLQLKGTGIINEVQISYRPKGASAASNMIVHLVKEGKKQLFFFDEWKVVPDNYIAHDYSIQVPKGVEVQLDGVKIDDTYREDESQAVSSTMDTYVIPDLFAGSHELVLKHENMENIRDIIETEDKEYYIENMPVKKEVKEKLVKKAAADLKTIYIQGFQQADFSKIKSIFSNDTEALYGLQYGYNDFKEGFQGYDNDLGLKSVLFSNIKGTVTHEYKEGNSIFEVQLEYFYNAKSNILNWDGTYKENMYQDTGTNTFVYVVEDGKWVIKSFDFNAV